MTSPHWSEEELTLQEVERYYEDSLASLRALKARVLANRPPFPDHFIGLTLQEVNTIFEEHELELDRLASFSLLSATEASLRIDFYQRVSKRKKNAVARQFQSLHREHGSKISLEAHILETWKVHLTEKRYVSDFHGMLNYRHWLAHGRYWVPNLPRKKIDFQILYFICDRLEQIIKSN
ncbi:hypothetical protein NST38_30655 [Paenibacillus sp. FSL H8-0104]|uniref:hypothetical protein n=1 Tax=Paenibacillus sp. FSL H8-0104 TaxID=2954509 RepID=UPI0030FDC067